jgi:3-deoxy-D-manno-octulosonic-acid transferase
MTRFIYSFVLTLAMPLIVLRLFWRSRRQRGYREHIGERFGFYPGPPLKGAIWIHAVSVGETRAAEPLVKALLARFPQRPIVLTCMTPTGRDTAQSLFSGRTTVLYLPYDLPGLAGRLIAHIEPVVLLIMETEIWPNLIAAARDRQLPVMLVNGRMSEKSQRAYSRIAVLRQLSRDAFSSLACVAAQSTDDAARFASLGAARIEITGNIKFDMTADDEVAARGRVWKSTLGSRRVLVAGSTREGEEVLLLDAYATFFDAPARARTLLVIVPRHPQRFDEVFALAQRLGFKAARRSAHTDITGNIEVWVGDSMGEMAAYYALADVVMIGGSFVPVGGQNLIEAAALGKPLIMGPSTFNFADAARLAVAAGAMKSARDPVEAMHLARALVEDESTRDAMAQAAADFAATHRGATEKTMGLIAPLLSHR